MKRTVAVSLCARGRFPLPSVYIVKAASRFVARNRHGARLNERVMSNLIRSAAMRFRCLTCDSTHLPITDATTLHFKQPGICLHSLTAMGCTTTHFKHIMFCRTARLSRQSGNCIVQITHPWIRPNRIELPAALDARLVFRI